MLDQALWWDIRPPVGALRRGPDHCWPSGRPYDPFCSFAAAATFIPGRWESLDRMRIILAGMSNMLTSIVTAALEQTPEVIIAGVADGDDDLADNIDAAQAAGVILKAKQPDDFERFRPLLLKFPVLKVIVVTDDG